MNPPDAMSNAASSVPGFPRAAQKGLTLRPAVEADLPFLSTLYASTRWDELAPVPWPDEQKHAFLSMQFDAQHRHYLEHYPAAARWIVEHGGASAGRLYLDMWEEEHRIVDIALLPDCQGLGFGSALLGDVIEHARDAGKAVGIHVEKTNPAMTLYRRLGFQTVADKGPYDLLRLQPGDGLN